MTGRPTISTGTAVENRTDARIVYPRAIWILVVAVLVLSALVLSLYRVPQTAAVVVAEVGDDVLQVIAPTDAIDPSVDRVAIDGPHATASDVEISPAESQIGAGYEGYSLSVGASVLPDIVIGDSLSLTYGEISLGQLLTAQLATWGSER